METQTEMPSNTTAGSTVGDEELTRIITERYQECVVRLNSNSTSIPEPYCPGTFDGWSCWPDTPAGTTVFNQCPEFITGFDATQHKNIRGFMTHGGLMGLQEAVTFGVPLIGMPLFGDQLGNIHILVERGVALSLDYRNLKADKIIAAVNALSRDPKYKEKMKLLSKKFLDRPTNARDTVVFWIEYILKHGKDALRSPALDLTWWQVALLDVYGTIIAVALILLWVFKLLISTILGRILSKSKTSPVSKKQN